jgi:hypothetical protein
MFVIAVPNTFKLAACITSWQPNIATSTPALHQTMLTGVQSMQADDTTNHDDTGRMGPFELASQRSPIETKKHSRRRATRTRSTVLSTDARPAVINEVRLPRSSTMRASYKAAGSWGKGLARQHARPPNRMMVPQWATLPIRTNGGEVVRQCKIIRASIAVMAIEVRHGGEHWAKSRG